MERFQLTLYNQELQWASRWTPKKKKKLGKKNKTHTLHTPQFILLLWRPLFHFVSANYECLGFSWLRTINGGKPKKHVSWLTAKVNLVLSFTPLSFLPILSLPSLYSPFFRFFATLLSPSKLSHLTAKRSVNNFPLHYANASNPIGTKCLRLIRLCRNVEDLKLMMSVLIVKGLVQHEFIIGEFLRTCFHLGTPDLALSLF